MTGVADFAKAKLTLAVCAPQVPCGAAAQQVFAAAHVDAKPDTQEQDEEHHDPDEEQESDGHSAEGVEHPHPAKSVTEIGVRTALLALPVLGGVWVLNSFRGVPVAFLLFVGVVVLFVLLLRVGLGVDVRRGEDLRAAAPHGTCGAQTAS